MAYNFQRLEGLYLTGVPLKGRGLFCHSPIEKNAIIESAPVLLFNEKQAAYVDKTNLYNYYFSAAFLGNQSPELFGIKDPENSGALAMGLMSFCNHSENPNAQIEKTVEGTDIIFTLRALRDIVANEEITHNYGTVWFDLVKD